MKLIGKKLLQDFKNKHPESKADINSLEAEIEDAQWQTPHDLKNRYPRASIIGGRQVVFDICGNNYRLWVEVSYKNQIVGTVKIGTHKEYDKWDIK